ncbi:hypothetical protein EJB05_17893 [Eragrostis curvula]|uniref:Uncharacterized protein n=1 Tax=Eragrostis curvula TaxID=38414 RepID=A0A5J9VKC3_9POAL|nr:hypothetical protein EJB05_17893 [Eragrostis curvula]
MLRLRFSVWVGFRPGFSIPPQSPPWRAVTDSTVLIMGHQHDSCYTQLMRAILNRVELSDGASIQARNLLRGTVKIPLASKVEEKGDESKIESTRLGCKPQDGRHVRQCLRGANLAQASFHRSATSQVFKRVLLKARGETAAPRHGRARGAGNRTLESRKRSGKSSRNRWGAEGGRVAGGTGILNRVMQGGTDIPCAWG